MFEHVFQNVLFRIESLETSCMKIWLSKYTIMHYFKWFLIDLWLAPKNHTDWLEQSFPVIIVRYFIFDRLLRWTLPVIRSDIHQIYGITYTDCINCYYWSVCIKSKYHIARSVEIKRTNFCSHLLSSLLPRFCIRTVVRKQVFKKITMIPDDSRYFPYFVHENNLIK